MEELRSDIRDIRMVAKHGAFGNPNALGFWVYGRRRDGKTVPCKTSNTDGIFHVYSEYDVGEKYLRQDITEFTSDEWNKVHTAPQEDRGQVCNMILDGRLGFFD